MKNIEKFARVLSKIAIDGAIIAINKENGEPTPCSKLACQDCLLSRLSSDCGEARRIWGQQEVDKLTKEEREFIDKCDKIKYIARDKDGKLYGYIKKPVKLGDKNYWCKDTLSFSYSFNLTELTSLKFSEIKWEDDEPFCVSK